MSIVSNFDISTCFWEVNPLFKVAGKFASFYRSDTSRNKMASSKVMWAISLLLDKTKDNPLRNFPEKDKKEIIAEEFIRDPDFNWKKHQALIDFYIETEMSPSERSIYMLEEKMQEREDFLSKEKYTLETAKDLDSIVANTDKLFSMVQKLKAQIEKEKNEQESGLTKGGRTESAGERKEI